MENEEVDPGLDSEIDDEEIWYTDDPVADPKIDWFYKLRSFAPIAIVLLVSTIYLPSTVGGKFSLNSGSSIYELQMLLIQLELIILNQLPLRAFQALASELIS